MESQESARLPSEAFAVSIDFFEHSNDGVLYSAPDGRVLGANAAACRLLGLPAEEICRLGRPGLADPDDPRWAEAVNTRARTGRYHGPLRLRRGDGSTLEADVSTALFTNAEGEARAVVVIRPAGGAETTTNAAVLDRAGLYNLPAFVQLAEQQWRRAKRDGIEVGLVFIRLFEVVGERTRRASEASSAHFAELLTAGTRWGEFAGQVGPDDFAMLVARDTGDDLSAAVRPVFGAIDRFNAQSRLELGAHIGVSTFVAHGEPRIIERLDEATDRMSEHEAWERSHGHEAEPRCCFVLEHPAVIESIDVKPLEGNVELTERELEVLRLLAARRSYREVAETLFISLNTVKSHASHAYAKLAVGTRREAISKAAAAGLLAPAGEPAARSDRGEPLSDAPFERLARVTQALTTTEQHDEALAVVMTNGLAGLGADGVIVTLRVGDLLVPVATHGYTAESVQAFWPAPIAADLPMTIAARDATAVWVPNRAEAARRFPSLGSSAAVLSQAWAAVPLLARNRVFGAFGVSFLEPHTFDDAERAYLQTLAGLCALALRP